MKDFWNYVDQLSFISIAFTIYFDLTTADGSDEAYGLEKKAGSLAMFLMFMRFFYWMRLFDSTAAFIRILKEIIKDIRPFLIFLAICISMFAVPNYMLD